MSLGKPVIKELKMDNDMKDYAFQEATKAIEQQPNEKVRHTRNGGVEHRELHEEHVREEVQVSVALRSR